MQFFTDSNMQFPLVELSLNQVKQSLSSVAVWYITHRM